MFKRTCRIPPRKRIIYVVLALVFAGLLLAVVACEESTPASSAASTVAVVEETTSTAGVAPVTSEESTTTAVTETVTTTETVTATEAPTIQLDDADNGTEVVLHVGERMRIDLKPSVNDRVKSVEWTYEQIVVKETDSGTDKVGDVVTGAWLEVEGVVAGPVTIRASYEYPYGTVKTVWAVYVEVVGTATTVASGEPADFYLTEADHGTEVRLDVGQRVRINLAPEVAKRVVSVEWSYDTLLVKETDSGVNTINDVVVGAWLEVEAVAAGPSTIRAQYEYPGGTTVTPFNVFLTATG
jgi:hypothetical protein